MQKTSLVLSHHVNITSGFQIPGLQCMRAEMKGAHGLKVVVHNSDMAANTVDQVNANAPTYTTPQVSRPNCVLHSRHNLSKSGTLPSLLLSSLSRVHQPSEGCAAQGMALKPVLQTASQGPTRNSALANVRQTTAAGVPLNGQTIQGASPYDGEFITGDYIGAVVGVRIATPFFGTGFNFCIGKQPLPL
jgi:hypothetical protein